uniref:Reverse transcriptase domain-containing protein n=1 Tax=Tanacetum cinerariifolium TaxID=118510 RepID=A0A699H2R7_TANCI|nr:reverse transcriptase domain-containing protein [Tanacetum cinerariifolium]
MIDYALWEVIENGATLPKTQVVEGVTTLMPITTVEEKAQRRLEVKAKSTLMMGIPNEHQLTFNSLKDNKQLLEAVEKRFGFKRLNKADLDTMSMNDLYNNLMVYEPEVKVNTAHEVSTASTQVNAAYSTNIDNLSDVVICSFFASQPNSPQLKVLKKIEMKLTVNGNKKIGFDMSNVECYNCHKRRHFSRECRDLRNQDNKHKESSRRSVPIETANSTALVSCDGLGGYEWSDQVEEWHNYALMSFSSLSSDSKIFDNCKKWLGYENYNPVPPIYIGNFMPLTPDLSFTGLDEFANKPVAENCKAKSSKEETKVVMKNDDALIIEEWVSDNEEENISGLPLRPKLSIQLHAKIDGKKIIITESFVKRDLRLADKEGIDCLLNFTIFEQLTCMSPKTTAWNEFSSIMASAIICLATGQKFTFSKLILDSMIRNLDNVSGNFIVSKPSGSTESVVDKVVHKELGDRLVRAATTASSLEAEQDYGCGLGCQETIGDATAQTRVLELEKTKTTQQNEIDSLKRRVKKLEKRNRSRTHKLKRLYKVSLTARAGDEKSLGSEEVFVTVEEFVKDVNENVVEEVVNATKDSTATTTITTKEITLAQALKALKTSKPKVKGILIQDKKSQPKCCKLNLMRKKDLQERKLKDLKLKEFDKIQEMFEKAFRRVNTFEDFRTELVERKEKRAGEELIQESTKKQKVGNQGNVGNQNGNVVNENVQENVGNVLVNGNWVGCSYKEFLACNPKEYDGKGGAVVLNKWIEKMENVQDMSGCSIDQKVKYTVGSFVVYDDRRVFLSHEMQKLETMLWNHAMVEAGHAAYTDRFHELARLVLHLVTPKSRKIERYVYVLALQIHRMVAAMEPKTMQKAVWIFGALFDEAVRNGSIKKVKKRVIMGEPCKDKSGMGDNKRTRTGKRECGRLA